MKATDHFPMLQLRLTETRVANKESVGSFNAVDVEQAQRRVSAASAKKYSASAGPSKAATKASEKIQATGAD